MSLSVSVEVPLLVVKGADRASLEPARDAMEVEGVIAHTPSLVALLLRVRHLVRLAVHTRLHNMVPANSTVVNVNVPCPQSDGIPFFDFKPSLSGFYHV